MKTTEQIEEMISLLSTVEKLVKSDMSRNEILDVLETWDHDLCLEMEEAIKKER